MCEVLVGTDRLTWHVIVAGVGTSKDMLRKGVVVEREFALPLCPGLLLFQDQSLLPFFAMPDSFKLIFTIEFPMVPLGYFLFSVVSRHNLIPRNIHS